LPWALWWVSKAPRVRDDFFYCFFYKCFCFSFWGKKIGKVLESSFSIVKLTNFANVGEEFVKFWISRNWENKSPCLGAKLNYQLHKRLYRESKPQGGGSTPNQGLARVVSVIKEAHSTLILVNCKHVLPPCPRPLILRMPTPLPPPPHPTPRPTLPGCLVVYYLIRG